MKVFTSLLLTLIAFASVAVGQTKERIEVGVQSTSLTLFHPDFPGDDTQPGVGGRVTYNFNRSIAADAEVNFFPQKQFILTADGSAIQAQFGLKLGKRFEKFGVFAKMRPGFLSVNRVGSLVPGPVGPNNEVNFKIERGTFFTVDTGGVLELYPSRRTVVRFDAGDTVIRQPARFGQVTFPGPVELIRPAKFNHNFQFTAGVGFRLGDADDGDRTNVKSPGNNKKRAKRFEVGAQFTSLLVDPGNPRSAFVPGRHAEPGLGGRFTFNLTDSLAFEAEGNYYTRLQTRIDGGHMFQGQFGAKIGKRLEKWGLFGKTRPGFVGFSRVIEFGFVQVSGNRFVRKIYPSLDVGGVVEFYVSRRWMARFDVGDTLIHYPRFSFPGLPPPNILLEGQTRHHLQVSTGIGFSF